MNASYTVVVPVYNATSVVARTLGYMLHTGVDPDCIVVADDCSSDPAMGEVSAWARSQGVHWQRATQNLGYTRNVNRCLEDVSTPHVLLVNSDCFIGRRSIETLCGVLEKFDLLGCVGPLSSNAGHQTVQLKRDIRWQALSNEEVVHFSERIERLLSDEFGLRPWLMPSVNGFCCLWRTSILRSLNYFDGEEFPRGYGEEDDACLRLMETGRFPAVAPFVFAPHLKTQSFSTKERDALKGQAQNKLRMKFSNAYIERLLNHNARNPQLAELKRISIGG